MVIISEQIHGLKTRLFRKPVNRIKVCITVLDKKYRDDNNKANREKLVYMYRRSSSEWPATLCESLQCLRDLFVRLVGCGAKPAPVFMSLMV